MRIISHTQFAVKYIIKRVLFQLILCIKSRPKG